MERQWRSAAVVGALWAGQAGGARAAFTPITGMAAMPAPGARKAAFGTDVELGRDGISIRLNGRTNTPVDASGAFQAGYAFGRPSPDADVRTDADRGRTTEALCLFVSLSAAAHRGPRMGRSPGRRIAMGLSVAGDFADNRGQIALTATVGDGRTRMLRLGPGRGFRRIVLLGAVAVPLLLRRRRRAAVVDRVG